jgi:hypothetical protein
MKINGFYYNYSKPWPVLYKTRSYLLKGRAILFTGYSLCATIKTKQQETATSFGKI